MNAGVAMLMNLGVLATRLTGGISGSEAQRSEMRGLRGILNIEFTGEDGAAWHAEFDDGRVSMRKGAAENPRATARLRPEDYLAMLAGDLRVSVARMTGKIRMTGDGNFGFLFAGMVESLRAAQSVPGLQGWVARALVRRALRKGRYRSAGKTAGRSSA